MRAVVNPPCLAPIATQDLKTGDIKPPAAICGGSTKGKLYLDAPGTVVVRFKGGPAAQQAGLQRTWTQARRVVDIPPRRNTDVRFAVPAGTQQWQLGFGWQGAPPDVPEVTSVTLIQGGTTTELLY
jgi:hypothetical protein